jgi:hypothetical protein
LASLWVVFLSSLNKAYARVLFLILTDFVCVLPCTELQETKWVLFTNPKNSKGSSLPSFYSPIMYFVLYPKNLPSTGIPVIVIESKPITKILQNITHQNIALVTALVSYTSLYEVC